MKDRHVGTHIQFWATPKLTKDFMALPGKSLQEKFSALLELAFNPPEVETDITMAMLDTRIYQCDEEEIHHAFKTVCEQAQRLRVQLFRK
jgi:hypothetical protein